MGKNVEMSDEMFEEAILKMPKIVLHLHLDGSLRPETVKEWLEDLESNKELFVAVLQQMSEEERNIVTSLISRAQSNKKFDLEKVKACLMVDKDCRDLNEYLEKFHLPVLLLQTKEHIKQAVYEVYEDLSRQGVIYGEVRFAPCLHTKAGLSQDDVVQAAIEGLNEAKEKLGIKGKLILCTMRGEGEQNKKENLETVDVAGQHLNKGVCAVDLAGAEALFPTENFEYIFKKAKELGIPFTIHAGEAAGPESIKKALEFGASRIGHGVRCPEDEEVMRLLMERETLLEMCPISNKQTNAVIGNQYPIREINDKGIRVMLDLDNAMVSNTNLNETYHLARQYGLGIEDLINMNVYAARGIFGTPQEKAKLVTKILQFNKGKEDEKSIS